MQRAAFSVQLKHKGKDLDADCAGYAGGMIVYKYMRIYLYSATRSNFLDTVLSHGLHGLTPLFAALRLVSSLVVRISYVVVWMPPEADNLYF